MESEEEEDESTALWSDKMEDWRERDEGRKRKRGGRNERGMGEIEKRT